MAVVVLQAFAHERGAPGRAAGQDAATAHVAQGPGEVTDPLEAEHGIEEVDGHHRLAPGGVGRGERDEAGQRAGLGDALLEHLARGALGVVQGQIGVDRDVVLPVGRVDLGLGDQRLEPERAGLVRDDGRHQRADGGVAHEVAQQAGEHHGGRHGLLARPRGEFLEDLGVGPQRRRGPHDRGRAAGRRARGPGAQVLHGVGALGGADIGRVALQGGVGDVVGHVQAVAQRAHLRLGHLLDLVRGVARLDLGPERPALDRLGQNDGGRALLLGGQLVGGVELAVVVPAAGERDQLVVAQVLDQLAQAGVGAEEVLADVGPRLDGQLLVLAVDRRVHAVEQDTVDVLGQQRVPARAPDHLDHVPARRRGTPPRAPE